MRYSFFISTNYLRILPRINSRLWRIRMNIIKFNSLIKPGSTTVYPPSFRLIPNSSIRPGQSHFISKSVIMHPAVKITNGPCPKIIIGLIRGPVTIRFIYHIIVFDAIISFTVDQKICITCCIRKHESINPVSYRIHHSTSPVTHHHSNTPFLAIGKNFTDLIEIIHLIQFPILQIICSIHHHPDKLGTHVIKTCIKFIPV